MTPIAKRRSVGMTVLYALLAAVALGGAIKLTVGAIAMRSAGVWVGVAVVGALALGLALLALFAKVSQASCPACQATVTVVEGEGRRLACPRCYALLVAAGGQLETLPQDLVLDRPGFGIALSRGMQVPALCVACGAEAARWDELKATNVTIGATLAALAGSLAAGGLVVAGAVSRARSSVPYCAAHREGHDLTHKDGEFVLWARSWRFVRTLAQTHAPRRPRVLAERP